MKRYTFLLREIWQDKSILRAYLNYHLQNVTLKGRTIDVGGGRGEAYISFVKRAEGTTFETFDIKNGNFVDFETDKLPAPDNSYDTVLFLNVMEHIYNHQHIANEVMRITKNDGQMIGYVPFLMWYHPDHKDFFRHTHEAIEKIFMHAGATTVAITPNYCGPFIAAAQMCMQSFPRIIRPLIFSAGYILDILFFKIKGEAEEKSRYVLGYLFACLK